jgi:gas vesicle protein
MSQKKGFWEGLMLGAGVGLFLGFLTAPKSGEESRDQLLKIKKNNEDLIEEAKQKTEEMISKTRESIDNGLEKLSKLVEEKKKEKKI